MIMELKKKPSTPIINPETGLEIKKGMFISTNYIPGLSEELRRIFLYIRCTGNLQR